MAPSTAELYTPRRDINGPKCAHSSLRKENAGFAEKGGKTAEKNGMIKLVGVVPDLVQTDKDRCIYLPVLYASVFIDLLYNFFCKTTYIIHTNQTDT